MRKLLLIALLPLAGCAGNLQLLEQGKSHHGTWNAASKTLDATVDGTKYAGTFSQGATVGFGTGVSGTSFATGTAISSNGSGQAILTSADGKVIQCVFQASLGRGQGQCEGMDGRRFVLVIGG
jgi:hypothetical protein